MGRRMKFLKLMKNVQIKASTTTVRPLEDSASEVEEFKKGVQVQAKLQTPHQTRYFFSLH